MEPKEQPKLYPQPDPRIIYLTGFMGSGKTYAGSRLAHSLGYSFIDLDDLIELVTNLTISDIFSRHGEGWFRAVEGHCLRSILGATVVATGGGAPCFHGGMDYMNRVGTTVFLDPAKDLLLRRLDGARAHRPLLASELELSGLIDEKMPSRRPIYEQADVHLKYEATDFDVVAELESQIAATR